MLSSLEREKSMSLDYSDKVSFKQNVTMAEIFDPPHILQQKIEQLAVMIQQSKHLVAFTGAGISTSCGIPDFRGSKGVLALQRMGMGVAEASMSFDRAIPSVTHMALVELERVGILKFVISQNVDGLHLRSGIPREKLAELHGNSFREVCPSCGREYFRDFVIESTGMKKTPRHCTNEKCKARLRDSVLDPEDAVPEREVYLAEKHCQMADVVLCLGTSLQINPVCDIPLKTLCNGGKVVIVNLQQTPKDEKASLVIHGLVDKVISGVMYYLSLRIPPYVRVDFFQIVLTRRTRLSDTRFMKWALRVASVHGPRGSLPYGEKAPLSFINSVEVSFPGRPELKTAILQKQPFLLKRETIRNRPFRIMLKLNFSECCGCRCTIIDFPVDFEAPTESTNYDKEAVIRTMRETAIRDQSCGQLSLLERQPIVKPKAAIMLYAITTNVALYGGFPSSYNLENQGVFVKQEQPYLYAPEYEASQKRIRIW